MGSQPRLYSLKPRIHATESSLEARQPSIMGIQPPPNLFEPSVNFPNCFATQYPRLADEEAIESKITAVLTTSSTPRPLNYGSRAYKDFTQEARKTLGKF